MQREASDGALRRNVRDSPAGRQSGAGTPAGRMSGAGTPTGRPGMPGTPSRLYDVATIKMPPSQGPSGRATPVGAPPGRTCPPVRLEQLQPAVEHRGEPPQATPSRGQYESYGPPPGHDGTRGTPAGGAPPGYEYASPAGGQYTPGGQYVEQSYKPAPENYGENHPTGIPQYGYDGPPQESYGVPQGYVPEGYSP